MTDFFTADTHFGHKNIIDYDQRPFSSVEEMDNAIISNWNRVVKEGDTVYHLGDFAFKTPEKYIKRLNGNIILIRGNHDNFTKKKESELFVSVHDISVLKPKEGQRIVLCHYPLRSWQYMQFGSYHLHGHTHGTIEPLYNTLDVGIMESNFAPVSLEDIQLLMDLCEDLKLPDFNHFVNLPIFTCGKGIPSCIQEDGEKAQKAYENGEDF